MRMKANGDAKSPTRIFCDSGSREYHIQGDELIGLSLRERLADRGNPAGIPDGSPRRFAPNELTPFVIAKEATPTAAIHVRSQMDCHGRKASLATTSLQEFIGLFTQRLGARSALAMTNRWSVRANQAEASESTPQQHHLVAATLRLQSKFPFQQPQQRGVAGER